MDLPTLLEINRRFAIMNPSIVFNTPKVSWVMDVRTIRYYQIEKLISACSQSERDGRRNIYTVTHFKEILAVKFRQADGHLIRKILDYPKDPDDVLREHGIEPRYIEEFVETQVKEIENGQETEEVAVPEPTIVATETEEVVMSSVAETTTKSPIAVEITDAEEYQGIKSGMKIGGRFVFLSGLTEDAGKKLYRKVHGQLNKSKGSITQMIVPVDEDGFDLLGCTVKGVPISRDLLILSSDKDVYREAEDVATIFVIDPANANKKISLQVVLDGVMIETLEAHLDCNGCGAVRYATVASGRYTIYSPGHTSQCSFEAAKYLLAPLTATLALLTRNKETLNVGLLAQSFGQNFEGDAIAAIMHDGKRAGDHDVKFVDGLAKLSFDASKFDGALSIMVIAKSDSNMVANVPLPGSRKAERDETEVCQLGTVTTVSMMASEGSKEERCLFFNEGAATNNPVRIKSCVSKTITVEFMADANDANVMIEEPVTGKRSVYPLGNKKKGSTAVYKLNTTMASVHVGAFINEKPWEGHATIVKPSDAKVSIDAPDTLKPGETLKLKVRTKAKSSVFVRIADKRMRVHDDAKTSLAAMMKRWISGITGSLITGEVSLAAPDPIARVLRGGAVYPVGLRIDTRFGAAMDDGRRYMVARNDDNTQRLAARQVKGKHWEGTGPATKGTTIGQNQITYTQPQFYSPLHQAQSWAVNKADDSIKASNMVDPATANLNLAMVPDLKLTQAMNKMDDDLLDADKTYFAVGGYSLASEDAAPAVAMTELASLSAPAATIEAPKAKQKQVAREMIVDLVYCGLVDAEKADKTLSIRMPDCIGEYDVTAFAVSNGDWAEARHDLSVTKEAYLEPMIPQYAHPEDEIDAVVIGVRAPKCKKYSVTIDGKGVGSVAKQEGENVRVWWQAKPGVHEVVMLDEDDNELDKIIRVVECPGEETVLGQETRILKKGESFDISSDEDALSVSILPGLDGELKVAVHVCTSFEHYCCEQTSSMIVAACVAAMVGEDSVKEQAYQSIIAGEARLRKMHVPGRGFNSYPGSDMVPDWSTAAARRTANLGAVLSDDLPSDVRKAAESIINMGKDALKAHGNDAWKHQGAMEAIYYKNSKKTIKKDDIQAVLANLNTKGYYTNKAEASYCAAALVRDGNLDDGIVVSNAVCKAMAGTLGGAMHGSYETLAYMHLVQELQKAEVVPNSGSGKVKVNGKSMTIDNALKAKDVTSVEASSSAVAVKITRINRIRFDEYASGVKIEVQVKGKNGKAIKAGEAAKLIVKNASGYKDGDVLCVALPDCLSRIVAGAKTKKFQIDFAGKDQVEVDLVAGSASKPQHWAAVVRNMYDADRIGSVGLLATKVE